MNAAFEKALVNHCSPVLLGRKPAAMVSLPRGLRGEVAAIPAIDEGLAVELLCARPCTDLVMIYRPALLRACLQNHVARQTLRRCGYPVGGGTERMLACLKQRIACHADFPHEVGFFLGYPVEDVTGFIHNKGRGAKCCGQWKVYGSVERALSLFSEYKSCREHLLHYLDQGGSLANLGCPANKLLSKQEQIL